MSDESVILLYNIEREKDKNEQKEIILQQNIQLLRRGLRRVYGLFLS